MSLFPSKLSDSERANKIANRNTIGSRIDPDDIAWLLHQFWDHHPNSNRRKLDTAYKADMEDTISKIAKVLDAKDADEVLVKVDLLKTHLRWVLNELADGQTDMTPAHTCGYTQNPESGHCDFHHNYWNARKLAFPEEYK